VLGRWHHVSSDRFDTTVQMFVEKDNRNQLGVLGEYRRTLDFELEQHFAAGRHDLVWAEIIAMRRTGR
jgi:hypothetical protein